MSVLYKIVRQIIKVQLHNNCYMTLIQNHAQNIYLHKYYTKKYICTKNRVILQNI